jgi:hypothetical protein
VEGVIGIDFDRRLVVFDCNTELPGGKCILCTFGALLEELGFPVLFLELGVLRVGAEASLKVPAKTLVRFRIGSATWQTPGLRADRILEWVAFFVTRYSSSECSGPGLEAALKSACRGI